jgi:hypothetical protein
MSGRRRWKSGRRFIQLWSNVKRSQAYHNLSVYARCALIELLDPYTGCNNGMIGLGCRELAEEMRCSRDTAARALRELDDSALARPLTPGVWRGKRATEWQLTFYRCDKTGELPVNNWPARSQSDGKDTKVSVEGQRPALRPITRTQKPKNSMSDLAPNQTPVTHIDVYQGDRSVDKEPARSWSKVKPGERKLVVMPNGNMRFRRVVGE